MLKDSAMTSKVDDDSNVDVTDYNPFAARDLIQANSDFMVFMHLMKASVGSGILFLPHAFRRAGYVSALVSSIVIGLISCHTAMLMLVEHFINIELDIRIYVIIYFPIYCSMALIPNLKNLVPCSILGALLLGLGFTITLYYLFIDIPSPGRLRMFTDTLSIPIYGSIFLFALHNMTMIMPLENSMKNPQNMPRILAMSMILNIFIYVSFGFFGYNKYPDACDTVIKNLPLHQTTAQIVKIVVTLSVMCSYGLHYYVPVNILWPMISRKLKGRHHLYEVLFRIGGVAAMTLCAVAIPQMTPLLGLLTAFSMTTMMLLLPVIIELMTKWYNNDQPLKLYFRWIKDIIIIIIWLTMLIFGISENLRDIIKSYIGSDAFISTGSC